jgi:hypothetical protein
MRLRPRLPVLFMTGYADLKSLHDVGEDRIIRKPFRDEELARKIGAMMQNVGTSNVVRLRK